MSRTPLYAVLGVALLVVLAIPAVVLLLDAEQQVDCATGPGAAGGAVPAAYTGPGLAGLDERQTAHAAAVVATGQELGLPREALVIALAVVSQESRFKMYANDGQGSDLTGDQADVARSLDLPHDAVGTDHGSVGLFQQQYPWWGSLAELMDPATSARKFYEALRAVPGWQSMPLTVAAQRVQRSAFPDAYADDEALARRLVEQLLTSTAQSANGAMTPGEGPGSRGAGVGPYPGGQQQQQEQVADDGNGDPYGLGAVKPQLRALVDVLAPMFGITDVGGYRASATDPGGHPSGLAADFMVPLTDAGREQGQRLVDYAQANARQLGIDYIIWYGEIWSVARANEGWRPMEDRGSPTANHLDHPHINVLPDGQVDASSLAGAAPAGGWTGDPECDVALASAASGAGEVVHPMSQASRYSSADNYGESGSSWSSTHTGTDFSASCGEPIVAAHAGRVRVRTDQSWSGRWLVVVETGETSVATWYAHMQSIAVTDGAQVQAGQPIGEVGSEGNSTGCHLHFEVHPSNGGWGEDDVDPLPWLDQATSGAAAAGMPAGSPGGGSAGGGGAQVRILTYNIRFGQFGLDGLARDIRASGADIVALQEVDRRRGEAGQAAQLARRLGMNHIYAPATTKGGGKQRGNALLSRFPMTQTDAYRLPRASGSETRNLVGGLINTGGTQVAVFGTHFDFTRAGGRQAAVTAQALANPRCATFLAGDFNFAPSKPLHDTITGSGLSDPFATGRFGPGRTVPVGNPRARIDYVLHSPHARPTDARVLPRGASDHRGVVTTFTVDPTASCT